MARKLLSRVGGFVHDIVTVASLSDEPNNIRLLSDRSLYILQNLSAEDVTFLSRYGEILTGDFYFPVLPGTSEASDVEDAIDIIRRDLNSMAVEELLECICQKLTVLAEVQVKIGGSIETAGQSGGTDVDVGPLSAGSASIGEGGQFPDNESYQGAKCSTANGIYDTVLGVIDWMDANSVDLLAGLFGGVTTGLVAAMISAGPVGWATALAASVVAAITSIMMRYSLNFGDISDALGEEHSAAVLALNAAQNSDEARDEFLLAIDGATTPITALERLLLSLLLPNVSLNQLFTPRSDVAAYTSPDPISCPSIIWAVTVGVPTTVLTGTSVSIDSEWGTTSPFVPLHHGVRVFIPGGIGDRTTDITAVSGWTDNGIGVPTLANSGYIDVTGAFLGSNDPPLVWIDDVCVQDGQFVHISSGSAFSMTIEYKTACP